MGYKKISPSIELLPFVDHFWIIEIQEEDLQFTHTILPYAWFELFFNLDDSSFGEGKFMGQLSKSVTVCHHKPYRAVGVCLKPGAGNALFSIPANELVDQNLNWSDLDNRSNLHEQLVEANSVEVVINLLESYLHEKLKSYELDQMAIELSGRIANQSYHHIEASLFSTIRLTRRRIEQRFLESVGVSMGMYLRKSRFDAAVDCLAQGNTKTLTQLGLDLGYYDQSQFSREFKEFAGISPKEYRNSIKRMSEFEKLLQYI
jgi:AraC-like DNA-binding protein